MRNINSKIVKANNFVEDCYIAQTKAFSKIEFDSIHELLNKELQENLNTVLDVGTGEGNFIKELAARYPTIQFTAIDADSRLIEIARQKYTSNNLCFKNTLFDQDYPKEEYDLILARFSVEHMPDVQGFISEAYKRLRSKGCILITEYYVDDLNSDNDIWRLFKQKEFEFYLGFGSHPRISTELPRFLKDSRFSGIKSRFLHICPSVVGSEAFYNLIISYSMLYNNLDREIFDDEMTLHIIEYCHASIKRIQYEDGFFISHTFGWKE